MQQQQQQKEKTQPLPFLPKTQQQQQQQQEFALKNQYVLKITSETAPSLGIQILKQNRAVLNITRIQVSRLVVDDITRRVYEGYSERVAKVLRSWDVTSLINVTTDNDAATVEAQTTHEGDVRVLIHASAPAENKVSLHMEIKTVHCDPGMLNLLCPVNRIGVEWQATSDEERLYGLGERFNTNERGDASITTEAYCWTEDGGWDLVPDIKRRWPKKTATYMPSPFLVSDGGYVVHVDTYARTLWQPGTPSTRTHAVFAEDARLPLDIYDGEGNARVARDAYVRAHAGVPLIPPPFQFGVWEGFQSALSTVKPSDPLGVFRMYQEWDIPISVADTSLHFFPNGDQREVRSEVAFNNSVYRAAGLAPFAYFNPFVATSYELAWEDASQMGLLVRTGPQPPRLDTATSAALARLASVGLSLGEEMDCDAALRKLPSAQRQQAWAHLGSSAPTLTRTCASEIDALTSALLQRQHPYATPRPDAPFTFAYKGAGPDPFYVSLLDFSKNGTERWYAQHIDDALEVGYMGWMYDYGEYGDTDLWYANNVSASLMHNQYPELYQAACLKHLRSVLKPPRALERLVGKHAMNPKGDYAPDATYFVRSGYSKSPGNTYNSWTGDPTCDFSAVSGLAGSVVAMLSQGLMGMAFAGSDVYGFTCSFNGPTYELMARWVQLGAMSGNFHTRNGGTNLFGAKRRHKFMDSVKGRTFFRVYAKLRTQLFPYLYMSAHAARTEAQPLMRHHILSHPHDVAATRSPYQYMLGENLLVAPLVHERQVGRDVYFPCGNTYLDIFTNATTTTRGGADGGGGILFDSRDGRFRIRGGHSESSGTRHHGCSKARVTSRLEHDLIPVFAIEGSAIPILDPTVTTLGEKAHDVVDDAASLFGARATDVATSLATAVHWWVFPTADERGWSNGESFDGCTLSTRRLSSGDLSLSISESRLSRVHVIQIALDASSSDVAASGAPASLATTNEVDGERTVLDESRHWSDVANIVSCDAAGGNCAAMPNATHTAWTLDREARVLWVRIPVDAGTPSPRLSFSLAPVAVD